jgi:hypothetical protein
MKRLLVISALLAVALAIPVAVAAPAYAKGATDVVVSGPGIDEVRLGYTRRTDDVDVGSLAEVSGIYLIYGAAIATHDPGLTRAELGPRYQLTWYQGSSVMSVSHVYPFASQGAWMHIPYEQRGWVRGGRDLEDAMVELGATPPRSEASEDSGASTGPTAVGSGSRTGVEPVETASSLPEAGLAGLAAVAVLLVVTGVWTVRRRRTPQPA